MAFRSNRVIEQSVQNLHAAWNRYFWEQVFFCAISFSAQVSDSNMNIREVSAYPRNAFDFLAQITVMFSRLAAEFC